MRRGIQGFLIYFGIALSNLVCAGEVTWIPPSTAEWKGAFTLTEWRSFRNIIEDHPVTHLSLVDSNGGAKVVAQWVIRAVREKNLSTSAKGTCNSACALAFLASSNRVMLPSGNDNPTKILIHGYFDADTSEPLAPTEEEIDFLMTATAGKMSRKFVELILHTKSIRGGLMVFEKPIITVAGTTNVIFCDVRGDNSGFACAPQMGADAMSLGIVTPNVKPK